MARQKMSPMHLTLKAGVKLLKRLESEALRKQYSDFEMKRPELKNKTTKTQKKAQTENKVPKLN